MRGLAFSKETLVLISQEISSSCKCSFASKGEIRQREWAWWGSQASTPSSNQRQGLAKGSELGSEAKLQPRGWSAVED